MNGSSGRVSRCRPFLLLDSPWLSCARGAVRILPEYNDVTKLPCAMGCDVMERRCKMRQPRKQSGEEHATFTQRRSTVCCHVSRRLPLFLCWTNVDFGKKSSLFRTNAKDLRVEPIKTRICKASFPTFLLPPSLFEKHTRQHRHLASRSLSLSPSLCFRPSLSCSEQFRLPSHRTLPPDRSA